MAERRIGAGATGSRVHLRDDRGRARGGAFLNRCCMRAAGGLRGVQTSPTANGKGLSAPAEIADVARHLRLRRQPDQAGATSIEVGLSTQLWQLSGGDPERISVRPSRRLLASRIVFAATVPRCRLAPGYGLVALINLLNPELIVIGGGMMTAAADLLQPHLELAVRDRALIGATSQDSIEASTLREPESGPRSRTVDRGEMLEPMFSNYFTG